jgi:subtilisin-like proprotein convertase family protein
VKQLIKASVATETPGGGGGGTTKEFPVTPGTSIPDANTTGINVDIPVTGVTSAKSLAVSVDITHTYRGDLVLKLLKNGTVVKTLVENQGGSADNLVETYTLTAAEIGTDVNTKWTLNVSDTEAQDTGKVNKVTLSFSL